MELIHVNRNRLGTESNLIYRIGETDGAGGKSETGEKSGRGVKEVLSFGF